MTTTAQKVIVSMQTEASKELVKFKVDGGRFASERTIKLVVDTPYLLEMTFKPARVVERLNVQGGNVTATEKSRTLSEATYTAVFSSSGTSASKKGKRDRLAIIIEMKDAGSFSTILQCKFYADKDKTHCKWGDTMNFIEYDCKLSANALYLDVVKETYR